MSNQVAGRLLDRGYDRNAQWSKLATLYLPALVLGSLPFSLAWSARTKELLGRWRRRAPRAAGPELLFVSMWLLVPLFVFSVARSRLPLYLLPLFSPIALLAGRRLAAAAPSWTPRQRRTRLALGLLWLALLGALKVTAAVRPDHRDGRRLAAWIRAAAPTAPAPAPAVWAVDADLHSLPFYGGSLRVATTKLEAYPTYAPLPRLDATLAAELPAEALLVTPRERLPLVEQAAAGQGFACVEGAADRRLALLHCVRSGDRDSS